ncbi:guanylate-binding protein 4-like [Hypomesus transpacificus]|uniref:guanylate-binding protein 4-like n=1 Tax=Hypomesus transpacificus TaxID=137520 RepID=UPI001F07207B|nr:guanylate-binding protein 4-like [Hypomesus transpacificus]
MYVETISQGAVPCLENAVLAVAQMENQAAVEEGLKLYQSCIEPLKTRFPVDMDQMSEHQRADHQATQEFMNRSFKDENGEFLTMLATGITKHYEELLTQNGEASEKKCQDLLRDLSAPVAQKIQDGFFAKPGGYELYCDLHDNLVALYRSTPNKGIRAEEVLERLLKEKSVESNSILQADQKLTDSKKKIHEEKERAALMEQEKKATEKKYEEMELKMEDDRRSQEVKMMKMEEKMKKEFRQQQEEFNRAQDHNLKEQKALLEQGFKEKADLMRRQMEQAQEMQMLKNEIDRLKRRKPKNCVIS